MKLDDLRQKVLYQNTVDVWIAACEESNSDWYDAEAYKKFISHLREKISMKKFPLCIKEVGGEFERGKDKTKFAELLAESEDPNAGAYTIKLNDTAIGEIRNFKQ